VARRVMELIGLGGDERYAEFSDRVARRADVDARMEAWMQDRTRDQVLEAFDAAHAAAAPVYDMSDIYADEHYRAREAITEVDGFPMQNVVARLSATPGRIRWTGRPLDADGEAIRAELDD
jgi:crotonobetainyl-CoA:carnitine CoA-transferase CaiB-like acyl-CoA transferase